MRNSIHRLILPTLLLAVCLSYLNADDAIRFSGGYTRAVMIEGREAIVLTQGAEVEAGPISLKAQRIELFGTVFPLSHRQRERSRSVT